MIESIAEVLLPVGECLSIKKQRIKGGDAEKRICIVTGTHGDELEGQYVAYELQRRINESPDLLEGIVDIYPALNPLGIDSMTRGIPGFDLDMNRIFPGGHEGTMTEYIAAKIVDDLSEASLCVDIHASNIFLREIPQIRISEETSEALMPFAMQINMDFVWIHSAATVLESTLAHSLNARQTPTLVVEMGVGMRITRDYCEQLVDGLFVAMSHLGIWHGKVIEPKKPMISRDGCVSFINAEASGIFLPSIEHSEKVKKGEHLGDIINPMTCECVQRVVAPANGLVFTLREYPVVDEGSLIARILEAAV